MERLELVDPANPEKGFKLKPRNRYIPEYEEKLGKLSITDGLPVIRTAPSELPPSTPPPRPDA